jgi:hypothetical protein
MNSLELETTLSKEYEAFLSFGPSFVAKALLLIFKFLLYLLDNSLEKISARLRIFFFMLLLLLMTPPKPIGITRFLGDSIISSMQNDSYSSFLKRLEYSDM